MAFHFMTYKWGLPTTYVRPGSPSSKRETIILSFLGRNFHADKKLHKDVPEGAGKVPKGILKVYPPKN